MAVVRSTTWHFEHKDLAKTKFVVQVCEKSMKEAFLSLEIGNLKYLFINREIAA
jgi:hypothetical protein